MDNVVEVHLPMAKGKQIEINTALNIVSKVYADPDKIEQVMENLVSNAVKYTNAGQIDIIAEQHEDIVTVKVIDTGIGISEEHLERLFDRFYRTDKARSRDKGGTGLGLAVVKGILRAHDSAIIVSSEVGTGSTFSFTLNTRPQ